ncbi:MAG: hypothetical protein H6816_06705 [Phycisphaerales bacterium]|nr:hypothetical protein [Phycisphaerales bacterium]
MADRPSTEATPPADKKMSKWEDPSVPAGDAPPLPRWPLYASGAVFALWVCFLIAMAIVRVRTTAF